MDKKLEKQIILNINESIVLRYFQSFEDFISYVKSRVYYPDSLEEQIREVCEKFQRQGWVKIG